MTALLIDLDGVLYEGDEPVAGAAETMAWLQEQDIRHLFLTNTTSRPRSALVDQLAAMNVCIDEQRILTPPVAAARWLDAHVRGPVALFVPAATVAELGAIEVAPADASSVAAVVIGDYGESWTFGTLNRAFRLLMNEPRPALVALGMTRYWRAADGLRLDTAPFVVALAHASGAEPVVLGKPAAPFFETALGMLHATPAETWMIGDDIRGDVLGAQDAGLHGLLVKTGKFRPSDLAGDIRPDQILSSIADLPPWWTEETGSDRGFSPK